jgi:hypothetical protein
MELPLLVALPIALGGQPLKDCKVRVAACCSSG